MFCGNCGKELPDNTAFCPQCGTNLVANAEQQRVQEPEIDATQPVNMASEQPVYTQQPVAEEYNYFKEEIPDAIVKTPKGRGFGKILLFVVLPIVLVFAVVASPLVDAFGLFGKEEKVNFDSPSEHIAYVEAKALGTYTDFVAGTYDELLLGITEPIGVNSEISLEVGDFVTAMLSQYAGGMDFSWLKNVKIKMDGASDMKNGSVKYAVALNDRDIVTVDVRYDLQNQTIYLGCKELFDKYVAIEIPDVSGMFDNLFAVKAKESSYYDDYDDYYDYDMYGMSTTGVNAGTGVAANSVLDILNNFDVKAYLPSGEQVKNLLNKYINVALGEITDKDLTKTSGQITANGVSQDCSVFALKVTPDLLQRVVKAVLESAKNDTEIIAIIEKILKGTEELAGQSLGVDIASEYKKAIDEILGDIDDIRCADILLTTYVNGSNDVIGRDIAANFGNGMEKKVLTYKSAENNGDYGFEFKAAEVEITGKGNKNGDAVTGDFSLVIDGREYVKLALENFSASLNGINGSVTVKLGSAAMDLIEDEIDMSISGYDPAIKFDFSSGENGGSVGISLLTNGNLFAKLAVSSNMTEANIAGAPSEGEIVSPNEINEDNINLNKIIENLQNAGVPAQLLSLLQLAM